MAIHPPVSRYVQATLTRPVFFLLRCILFCVVFNDLVPLGQFKSLERLQSHISYTWTSIGWSVYRSVASKIGSPALVARMVPGQAEPSGASRMTTGHGFLLSQGLVPRSMHRLVCPPLCWTGVGGEVGILQPPRGAARATGP